MEPETQWRGQRDTGAARRLWRVVLVSLVLHIPVTPFAALLALFAWLVPPDSEKAPDLGPIRAIPIEMLDQDTPEQEAKQVAPEPTAFVLPPKLAPKPKPKVKHEEPDAGADDAGADAGLADAGTDAGGAPKISDPVALAGEAGKVADANANVRLIINSEVIRTHALGARIGTLLASVYQWRDFFGPTRIDPVRDIDRLLIAGPQLRDSSGVVVVIQHNTSEQKMRQAVDALVKRDPQGKWLTEKVPAAVARADRAQRYFVFPGPHVVVVAPPSAAQSALSLGPKARIPAPKGGEAMTAYVVTPWRVFMGMPFSVPRTIKWVRVRVIPRADGGVVAEIEAEDESDDTAARDAKYIEQQLNNVAHINLGVLSVLLGHQSSNFIERVSFTNDGKTVRGTLSADASQVSMLFDLVGAAIANFQHEPAPAPVTPLPRASRSPPRAGSSASAPPSASAP